MEHDISSATDHIAHRLSQDGYAVEHGSASKEVLKARIKSIASSIGVIRKGRHAELEVLTPKSPSESEPHSLSRIYGKGNFPWHMDTAHLINPSRFIVLGCELCNSDDAPTLMAEWQSARKTLFTENTLRSALFLVSNGRASFYANSLDICTSYLRHDPGCMTPLNDAAVEVQEKLANWAPDVITVHRWEPGAILVIDNWRLLHRRAGATASVNRRLLRCYSV